MSCLNRSMPLPSRWYPYRGVQLDRIFDGERLWPRHQRRRLSCRNAASGAPLAGNSNTFGLFFFVCVGNTKQAIMIMHLQFCWWLWRWKGSFRRLLSEWNGRWCTASHETESPLTARTQEEMQRLSDVSNLVLQLYEALHVEEHQVRTERQLVSQLEQLQVLFDA